MDVNTTHAQCQRVLGALKRAKRGRTSIYMTQKLGVLRPSARIWDLRQEGHNILTHWQWEATPDGVEHRVARYVLVGEA